MYFHFPLRFAIAINNIQREALQQKGIEVKVKYEVLQGFT
jgi:hypothetical protein